MSYWTKSTRLWIQEINKEFLEQSRIFRKCKKRCEKRNSCQTKGLNGTVGGNNFKSC